MHASQTIKERTGDVMPMPPETPRMDEPARPGGLHALFDLHRADLLRFLKARCGDGAMAEDLLQDLWLKLSRPLGGPVQNGRAYLFRMANNLVLDGARGRARAMRRDRDWIEVDGAMPEDRPDPADNAEDMLVRQQEAGVLHRAIDALPPGARRALWLYRIEEHSQAEVAGIMRISRSGVEKHLAVAMRHLRDWLAEAGMMPPAGHSNSKEQE